MSHAQSTIPPRRSAPENSKPRSASYSPAPSSSTPANNDHRRIHGNADSKQSPSPQQQQRKKKQDEVVDSQLKRGLLTAISLLLSVLSSAMATSLLAFSSHLPLPPSRLHPFFSSCTTTAGTTLLPESATTTGVFLQQQQQQDRMNVLPPHPPRMDVSVAGFSGGDHSSSNYLQDDSERQPLQLMMNEVIITCCAFLSRAKRVSHISGLVLCSFGCLSVITFACMINVQRSKFSSSHHVIDIGGGSQLQLTPSSSKNGNPSRISTTTTSSPQAHRTSPAVDSNNDGATKKTLSRSPANLHQKIGSVAVTSSPDSNSSSINSDAAMVLSSKDSFSRRSTRSSTAASVREYMYYYGGKLVANEYVSASARFSLPTTGDHAQCLETMKRNIIRAEDAEMSAYKARVAKHQFMAYVFHNMRVPFNAIVLGLGQLKTNPTSPKDVTDNKELLQMMLDCAETMTNVFDDISDMGKIEDGLMELEFEEFNMLECVNFICWRLKEMLREKQSCIVVNIDDSAMQILSSNKLLGDKNRVQQILGSFLYNVLAEAGEEGGSKLELSIDCVTVGGSGDGGGSEDENMEEDFICPCTKVGGRARMQTSSAMATFSSFACEHEEFTRLLLTIRDIRGNSIGLAGDDQARFFEPFETFAPSKSSAAAAEANFGTGLSMAKCFAQQVGGFIGIRLPPPPLPPPPASDEAEEEEEPLSSSSSEEINAVFTLSLPFPLIQDHNYHREMSDTEEADDEQGQLSTTTTQAEGNYGKRRRKALLRGDGKFIIVGSGGGEDDVEDDDEDGTERADESENDDNVSNAAAAKLDEESERSSAAATDLEQPKPEVMMQENLPLTRTVLVVEDTKINRMVIKKVLQNLNLNCDEAENGQIAVDLLNAGNRYDLILMDKEMPVMDGHEATRRLRSMGVKTPIVALTANALDSDRELFYKAGVDDFQTKPLSREKLVNLLVRFGLDFGPQETPATSTLEVEKKNSKAPKESSPPQQPDTVKKVVEEEPQQQQQQLTRTVLVVEDTKINRMVIKKVLQNLHLNCDEAENGQVAVDLVKSGHRYDLILMDKEMPVMDGHEATRRLRAMGVKTPIVALTANALESDRELFYQAGVDDFQTKPLSREKLVNLLARFGLDFGSQKMTPTGTVEVEKKDSKPLQESSPPPPAIVKKVEEEEPQQFTRTVLVVEDTKINRMVIKKVLQNLDLNCDEAENGQVAVDLLKAGGRYDLILMDKEMPVMDGHEATRRLRSMGVKTPIVALTANALESDRELFYQAGVDDFQTKPLSREKLVNLLARFGLNPGGSQGTPATSTVVEAENSAKKKKPLQDQSSPPPPPPQPDTVKKVVEEEEPQQQQPQQLTGTVLVVEDTKINRVVIKKVLQNLNLNCDEAENGQVAVDLMKSGHKYDLILMDKEMPVMDGHEATRRLRSMGVKTPIVALTANALESDRELFYQAGVDDFQTKPLSREKLVNLLARFGLNPCSQGT